MQIITIDEVRGAQKVKKEIAGAAVFEPIPGKVVNEAWTVQFPGSDRGLTLYTCPVSAIPVEAFELFTLWAECKALGVPPVAGGTLDQPAIVRRAWPAFEDEAARLDRATQATSLSKVTTSAVAVMLRAMLGGR